jgi:flagellar basal body-associated protein FliL
MLGKLVRGAVLLLLAVMIAAWAFSSGKQRPQEPQNNKVIEHWYM